MRIHFAHYLSVPFILGALGVLYFAWENEGALSIWIAPFLLVLAFIWVFTPQINWWWYSKRPPTLERGVAQAIARFTPFFQRLSAAGRVRFFERVALTRMATDWTAKNLPEDKVPPDIQTAVAVQAVIAGWTQKDFLFTELEKVILTPGSFLSPQHPYYHATEAYYPEKCMMFSARGVIDAFLQPAHYMNIALYEYLRARLVKYPEPEITDALQDAFLPRMERISGWTEEGVAQAIGIAPVDGKALAICHYLVFYDSFKRELPEWAALLDTHFFTEN